MGGGGGRGTGGMRGGADVLNACSCMEDELACRAQTARGWGSRTLAVSAIGTLGTVFFYW